MGAVAKGLIKYPTPGIKPPADCNIEVMMENREINSNCLSLDTRR
jgi:hypothetical protein